MSFRKYYNLFVLLICVGAFPVAVVASSNLNHDDSLLCTFHNDQPINTGGIKNAKLFLNADNLFDKVIVASEHEYGKRPNKPLSVMAGVKFDF